MIIFSLYFNYDACVGLFSSIRQAWGHGHRIEEMICSGISINDSSGQLREYKIATKLMLERLRNINNYNATAQVSVGCLETSCCLNYATILQINDEIKDLLFSLWKILLCNTKSIDY